MSLAEQIANMAPSELPPDNLAEIRENWEMGLEVVAVREESSGGWQTLVVLRDGHGDYHCHRYSCWAYGSRWDVFRDYIGSNPEAVMKWLCGVNVDNESK